MFSLRNEIPAGFVIIRVGLSKNPVDTPPRPVVLASNPTSLVPFCVKSEGITLKIKITASILVTDEIDAAVDDLLMSHNHKSLELYVHPFVYAYYTSGIVSRQMKWFLKYFKWVKLVKDTSLGLTDFKVMDDRGEEIELRHAFVAMDSVPEKNEE